MASFMIRADVTTITTIDRAVTAVAAALKTELPDLSLNDRRVYAVLLLICQQVPADSPCRAATPDQSDRAAAHPRPPWEHNPTDPTDRAGEPADDPVTDSADDTANRDEDTDLVPPDPADDDRDHQVPVETPEQAAAAVTAAQLAHTARHGSPTDPTAAAAAAQAVLDEQTERLAAATRALTTVDLATLLTRIQLYIHLYGGVVHRPERPPDQPGPSDQPWISPGPDPDHHLDPHTGELVPLDPIVRVEGHGPLTLTWLRETLGPRCRFKITPVLDLTDQAPVDAYEIPERHRTAVHLITPADVYPYATNTDRHTQIDHTIPWQPDDSHDSDDSDGPASGQSRIGNYGPMTLHHHRIKTHATGWHVQQPYPGIYLWRDPTGRLHLVDHTGTRTLPSPAETRIAARPIVVEIYRPMPDVDLRIDPDPDPGSDRDDAAWTRLVTQRIECWRASSQSMVRCSNAWNAVKCRSAAFSSKVEVSAIV